MLRLTKRRRALAAGKILDVANLVLAAIGIASILGEPRISPILLVATLAIWLVVYGLVLLLEPADD